MDIGYGISIWADKPISANMDIPYSISIWTDMRLSANMDIHWGYGHMAECIVAIERSVCEIAQSLSYLAKYCYNIAAIYNINHYIFNIYYYLYFSYVG
jgi:hypothetical protein